VALDKSGVYLRMRRRNRGYSIKGDTVVKQLPSRKRNKFFRIEILWL